MRTSCKYFIFFIALFCYNAVAQNSGIDSLKKLLASAKQETEKADLLCELSKKSAGEDAYNYAAEALTLSEKLNYRKGIAYAHSRLGKYFYFKEDFAASLNHSVKAYEIAKADGYFRISAYACLYIGFNHFQNEPKTSLEYYLQSIEFSKMAGDKLLESYANSAIGNLYEKWNDGKNALTYYLVSYKIREQFGDTTEQVSSLIETARAYDRMNQHDKQNEMVDRALKMAERKGSDDQNLIYLYQMKGYDYFDRLKDYKNALEYFLRSYNLVAKNRTFNKNNISSIKPIAETYLKLGDYKNASDYFKLYVELSENNQKKLDKELFESQFGLKKEVEKQKFLLKDAEILRQKVELQKQANIRNLFIAGSVILLIFVFFIYRNIGLKQKSNTVLEEKVKERTLQLDMLNGHLKKEIEERTKAEKNLNVSETKLTETNRELESFIYRASHDLKGPLSSSRGLINLALNAKDPGDTAKFLQMIAMSLDKLDNILVDLHELTIIRQGTIKIKQIDIKNIIKDLLDNFEGYDNYDRIKFSIDDKLPSGFYADEILIKTILRNVLENTVKYSRKNIQDPFVDIEIKEDGPWYLMTVSDNGIGILPELQSKVFDVFIRANDVTKGSGLGLYIAKNAMTKLNGKIEIESSAVNKGTTMNLFFPKSAKASAS